MTVYPLPLAFMEGLGGPEVVLIMVIILVLFGGDKLPEFARGAGKLIREFKKASSGVEEEFRRALEEEEAKKKIAPPPASPSSPTPALAPPVEPASPSPAPPPTSPPKMMPRPEDPHNP